MKHNWQITVILVLFFLLAQLIGLALISMDISQVEVVEGKPTPVHQETSLGPRPEMTGLGAFAYILIGVTIGTLLVLLIIRANKMNLWKIWFFLAVFIAMSLALGVIMPSWTAFIAAFILAILKVFKPNVIIHNITELLMYAGIAVFLVPVLNVFWAVILLLAISVYDAYAVWKSKHMVKMARFQAKSKVFAGLFIPYSNPGKAKRKMPRIHFKASPVLLSSKREARKSQRRTSKPLKKAGKTKHAKNAILGGGDIAFPLIFSGTVMEYLITRDISVSAALGQSLVIAVTASIALLGLFILAKKDRFYPAMPFITLGCLVGFALIIIF